MKPRILIFEWITGGGAWLDVEAPPTQLTLQANGIWSSLCRGFSEAGFEVATTFDARYADFKMKNHADCCQQTGRDTDLKTQLQSMAKEADIVSLVAPETGGRLNHCLHWLREFETKCINPSIEFTELASNKTRLCEFLSLRNILVPAGCGLKDLVAFLANSKADRFVLKPIDGCGGDGIQVVDRRSALSIVEYKSQSLPQVRVEPFLMGESVSVMVFRSQTQLYQFTPLKQNFQPESLFQFSHCSDGISVSTQQRAATLAKQVIDALPEFVGIVGLDMVIGDCGDYLIEVNPRAVMSCEYFWNQKRAEFIEGLRIFDPRL